MFTREQARNRESESERGRWREGERERERERESPVLRVCAISGYGVATISGLLKIIGLFCKRFI